MKKDELNEITKEMKKLFATTEKETKKKKIKFPGHCTIRDKNDVVVQDENSRILSE